MPPKSAHPIVARINTVEAEVCEAAISHFAVTLWRMSSSAQLPAAQAEAYAADVVAFRDWVLEYILSCREFGLSVTV